MLNYYHNDPGIAQGAFSDIAMDGLFVDGLQLFWCRSLTHVPQTLSSCNSAAAADFEKVDAKLRSRSLLSAKMTLTSTSLLIIFVGLLRPSFQRGGDLKASRQHLPQ